MFRLPRLSDFGSSVIKLTDKFAAVGLILTFNFTFMSGLVTQFCLI